MLRDYLALRRFIREPWAFLRARRRPLAGGTVEVAFRDGSALRLRGGSLDRHIFHRVFARNEYRLGGVEAGSWDTVVDGGAHIGIFAARAAPLARRLLCIEPAPENLELLRANLAGPRFAHVEVLPLALAAHSGTATLRLAGEPSAHATVPPPESGTATRAAGAATLEARALSLADLFAERGVARCDLLKLDCEGAEYEVLEAAPAELWTRIARIHLEYHPLPGRPDRSGEALASFLRARGYTCELAPSRRARGKGRLYARNGDIPHF